MDHKRTSSQACIPNGDYIHAEVIIFIIITVVKEDGWMQMGNLGHVVSGTPGGVALSLLPPWHIYERMSGYYRYSCGALDT